MKALQAIGSNEEQVKLAFKYHCQLLMILLFFICFAVLSVLKYFLNITRQLHYGIRFVEKGKEMLLPLFCEILRRKLWNNQKIYYKI